MKRHRTPDDRGEEFARFVAEKEDRKLRARKRRGRTILFGMGMFGLVGWSLTVPVLLCLALGIWLDGRTAGGISWTVTLLTVGFVLGALNACWLVPWAARTYAVARINATLVFTWLVMGLLLLVAWLATRRLGDSLGECVRDTGAQPATPTSGSGCRAGRTRSRPSWRRSARRSASRRRRKGHGIAIRRNALPLRRHLQRAHRQSRLSAADGVSGHYGCPRQLRLCRRAGLRESRAWVFAPTFAGTCG